MLSRIKRALFSWLKKPEEPPPPKRYLHLYLEMHWKTYELLGYDLSNYYDLFFATFLKRYPERDVKEFERIFRTTYISLTSRPRLAPRSSAHVGDVLFLFGSHDSVLYDAVVVDDRRHCFVAPPRARYDFVPVA